MTLVGDEYRELIAEHLSPRSPKIPFYSSKFNLFLKVNIYLSIPNY